MSHSLLSHSPQVCQSRLNKCQLFINDVTEGFVCDSMCLYGEFRIFDETGVCVEERGEFRLGKCSCPAEG